MFSFSHIDPDFDISFEKLAAQMRSCIWKTPSVHHASEVSGFHANPAFDFNIFQCDLYLDALIIELF